MGLPASLWALPPDSLTQWLGMQQGSIVMLAVIMSMMLALDMGGAG